MTTLVMLVVNVQANVPRRLFRLLFSSRSSMSLCVCVCEKVCKLGPDQVRFVVSFSLFLFFLSFIFVSSMSLLEPAVKFS